MHSIRQIARQAVADYKPTRDSIAKALAAAEAEREQARKDGCPIRADGTLDIPPVSPLHVMAILHEGLSQETRVNCGEYVDSGVEQFGLACVIRSTIAVAALNGVTLVEVK